MRHCTQLNVWLAVTLFFPASLLTLGCGDRVTEPASPFSIVSPHSEKNGVVVWDPNTEPILSLSVSGGFDPAEAEAFTWRQQGWQVDDSGWRGINLRVHVDSPGCGYGGHDFVVTAVSPDNSMSASVTVWMEPYICPGSPWLTE
jgi:hypothetical protein